jgi:hypothetical protein
MSGAGVPQPSDRAVAALIGWEVGDRAEYEKTEARPTWPGDDSGVTIGIGYDLGYEPAIRDDWGPHLPADVVQRLAAVGGRIRAAAVSALAGLHDIVVPWDAAVAVFRARTLPRYVALTSATFPGAERLSGDSLGALVSLVYNRGPALDGPTRTEMRGIYDALAEGRAEDVPQLIRGMKRLWPHSADLCDRRDGEALLFEAGLPQSMTDMG